MMYGTSDVPVVAAPLKNPQLFSEMDCTATLHAYNQTSGGHKDIEEYFSVSKGFKYLYT